MGKCRRYAVLCWLLPTMLVFGSCNSSAAKDPVAAVDIPEGSAAASASATSGSAVVTTATGVPGDIAYAFQPGDNSHMFSIHTVNRDGTENKLLMSGGGIGLNQPAWSPDGKTIATWGWLNHSTISIYSFNTDGSGLTRLTAVNNVYDMFPDWSPDGKRLTFTRQYPNQNDRNEIWVMNADGSAAALVAAGYQSKWRPDGAGLVFVSDKSGNYEIYTIDADGSDLRQITDTAINERDPSLSPDGRKLVYSAYADSASTFEIFVMDADGGNGLQLTHNDVLDLCPRWSPDGMSIVFMSDSVTPDHSELFLMNADGSGLVQLTYTPGNSTAIFPSWNPGAK